MRKITCVLDTGFSGCTHKTTIKVEDDATDEDIDEIVQEWALERVSWSWSELAKEPQT